MAIWVGTNKAKSTTANSKMMSNTGSTKTRGWTRI